MHFPHGLLVLIGVLVLVLRSIRGQIAAGPANKSMLPFEKQDIPCCHFSHDALALYGCIRNVHIGQEGVVQASTTLYTFVSGNILQYAAYALAINSAYARRNQYNFHILGFPQTSMMNNQPVQQDARWNKVHILWQAVAAKRRGVAYAVSQPWHGHHYTVWLDADLVLLDMDMKIELIAASHPAADIIMSRDIARAEFVSNSGFIIIRVSAWSEAFLERWWSTFDRRKCCDQNAFTWLFDELGVTDKEHISLLRADAINSDFPSWKWQKDFNQVLHLAGASSTLYRAPVFASGFAEVCSRNRVDLAHQLGLTTAVLQSFVAQTGHMRLAAMLTLGRQVQSGQSPVTTTSLATCPIPMTDARHVLLPIADYPPATVMHLVMTVRSDLEDLLKEDDDDCRSLYSLDAPSLRTFEEQLLALRRWIYESLKNIALKLSRGELNALSSVRRDSSINETANSMATLEALKDAVSAGFEWFLAMQGSTALFSNEREPSTIAKRKAQQQRPLLATIQELLAAMESGAPSSLRGKVLYYRFKHALLMSATHPPLSDDKLRWLSTSVDLWRVMVECNYFGSDYVMADPYKEGSEAMQELGTLFCSRQMFDKGLTMLGEAIKLHEKTLEGYSNIRIAARKDISEGMANLAQTLINAGICGYEKGDSASLEQSARSLKNAQALLEQVSAANRMAQDNNAAPLHDIVQAVETAQEFYAEVVVRLFARRTTPEVPETGATIPEVIKTRLFMKKRRD